MSNRLFIGNLEWHVTERELRDALTPAGGVIDVKIVRDPDGRSKGIGFAEMATAEEAARALKDLQEIELRGRPLRIEYARERANNSSRGRLYR